MSKEDYRMILVWAIKTQLDSVKEEIVENQLVGWEDENTYLEGVRRGLEIALEKLEASKFLTQKEEPEEVENK